MKNYLSEHSLENFLRLKIKSLGGLALKFTSPGQAGVPDRIIFMPGGKIYFAEMKSSAGKLSPVQKNIFEKLATLGFNVSVLNSKISVENFVKELEGQ